MSDEDDVEDQVGTLHTSLKFSYICICWADFLYFVYTITLYSIWILEKVLNFAQQFSRPGKSLENREKVLKKCLKFLIFFLRYNKCMASSLFFVLVKSYSILTVHLQCVIKKALFLHFFKVSIDHLQLYLIMSGELNDCFGNHLEKVLNFGSKNLYKPCTLL